MVTQTEEAEGTSDEAYQREVINRLCKVTMETTMEGVRRSTLVLLFTQLRQLSVAEGQREPDLEFVGFLKSLIKENRHTQKQTLQVFAQPREGDVATELTIAHHHRYPTGQQLPTVEELVEKHGLPQYTYGVSGGGHYFLAVKAFLQEHPESTMDDALRYHEAVVWTFAHLERLWFAMANAWEKYLVDNGGDPGEYDWNKFKGWKTLKNPQHDAIKREFPILETFSLELLRNIPEVDVAKAILVREHNDVNELTTATNIRQELVYLRAHMLKGNITWEMVKQHIDSDWRDLVPPKMWTQFSKFCKVCQLSEAPPAGASHYCHVPTIALP